MFYFLFSDIKVVIAFKRASVASAILFAASAWATVASAILEAASANIFVAATCSLAMAAASSPALTWRRISVIWSLATFPFFPKKKQVARRQFLLVDTGVCLVVYCNAVAVVLYAETVVWCVTVG